MILRLVYTKDEYMKFLGHLELMKFFERAFRRLQLPLSFTEGFNPHPKITFGGPLSVGVASHYEVMEVVLDRPINYDDFVRRFNATAPKGLAIMSYSLIGKSKSLMSALALATYEVVIEKAQDQEAFDVDAAYEASHEIILHKKNKKHRWVDKDLRPFIKSFKALSKQSDREVYQIEVFSSSDGSAKPSEIFGILLADRSDFEVDAIAITRTGLYYFEDETQSYKPLARL